MTNTDTPDLPAYYGKPINTPTGHRWAGPGRTIMLQPAMAENFRLPYPFHVDAATGDVGRQEFWQGDPAAVVGFQDSADVQQVDLLWEDAAQDPDAIVGKYPVMRQADGTFYTYTLPVESVTVQQ